MNVVIEAPERDANGWRIWRAGKQRIETERASLAWAAAELCYWLTVHDTRNAYYVAVSAPLVGFASCVSEYAGERVVRVHYEWQDIERRLVEHKGTLRSFSNEVLSKMADEGSRLRAALEYARRKS